MLNFRHPLPPMPVNSRACEGALLREGNQSLSRVPLPISFDPLPLDTLNFGTLPSVPYDTIGPNRDGEIPLRFLKITTKDKGDGHGATTTRGDVAGVACLARHIAKLSVRNWLRLEQSGWGYAETGARPFAHGASSAGARRGALTVLTRHNPDSSTPRTERVSALHVAMGGVL
jgi:hypothetical protein